MPILNHTYTINGLFRGLFMITNEILFLIHSCACAISALGALWLGPSALVGLVCMFGIIANIFVSKQITLFGFETIATDAFIVGSIFCLNMLQEHFGRAWALKAIAANFYVTVVYLIFSLLHVAYTPNAFDTMDGNFVAILNPMPRIIISSVIVYLISQYLDAVLFGYLKRVFKGKYLPLRNVLSMATSQLVDTVLFSYAALYGSVYSVVSIVIVSYSIKMIVIALTAPFTGLSYFIKSRDTHAKSI